MSQDPAVWQSRWDALVRAMTELVPAESFERKQTVTAVRDNLQQFAAERFNFFREGFSGERRPLPLSERYSPDFAFRAIILQAGYDVEVLERTVRGRQSPLADTLRTADVLAEEALGVATAAGLLPKTAALTYFVKSPDIRVIPYADAALVGVPFSAAAVERDLLAIPHEVGHYVFWNGQYHGEPLVSLLRNALDNSDEPFPNWVKRWLEETFADTFGAIVAGPVMHLDFQDLLLANDREMFSRDDGEHPLEPLRPYLYSAALNRLNFEAIVNALEIRWEVWLKRRSVDFSGWYELHQPEPDGRSRVPRREALAVLRRAANVLLDTPPLQAIIEARGDACWTRQREVPSVVTTARVVTHSEVPLYDEFRSYVAEHRKAQPEELETRPVPAVPEVEWERILAADGWTTKGPNESWP